jgi:hypothetical protein
MRLSNSEIIWNGSMRKRIEAGERVRLLAPHPDAGRIGIVRTIDVGGAVVQLLGGQRCFIWAGEGSLARHRAIAGYRRKMPAAAARGGLSPAT